MTDKRRYFYRSLMVLLSCFLFTEANAQRPPAQGPLADFVNDPTNGASQLSTPSSHVRFRNGASRPPTVASPVSSQPARVVSPVPLRIHEKNQNTPLTTSVKVPPRSIENCQRVKVPKDGNGRHHPPTGAPVGAAEASWREPGQYWAPTGPSAEFPPWRCPSRSDESPWH